VGGAREADAVHGSHGSHCPGEEALPYDTKVFDEIADLQDGSVTGAHRRASRPSRAATQQADRWSGATGISGGISVWQRAMAN
jgi:hypothetical protein